MVPHGQAGAALPVNKGVIVSTIVLDLKHTYPRYIPLKIEFQQSRGGRRFRNNHLLILADFSIPVATARIGARLGGCGDIRGAWVRLMDVVCAVQQVGEFDDVQVHGLRGLPCWVGSNAGEGARVLHRRDKDVERPVVVHCGPGRIGNQFALR